MADRIKKARKRKYIPRNTVQYQMNLTSAVDRDVLDIHQQAVQTKSALNLFRDGMRLMWSLRHGDTSFLFQLFPELEGVVTPHDEALLEQFRQMLRAEIKVIPTAPAPASGGIQEIMAPKLAAPIFDAEEDVISIHKDEHAGTVSSTNFLDAAFGFQDVEMDLSAGEPS